LLSEMSQMADNVVVIGKGKLITSTTISELVSGKAHAKAFVRSSKLNELKAVLKRSKISFIEELDGLIIAGHHTDEIGKIAFTAKLPVLELSNRQASLEEAFLELTADSQEFKANQGKKGIKHD